MQKMPLKESGTKDTDLTSQKTGVTYNNECIHR